MKKIIMISAILLFVQAYLMPCSSFVVTKDSVISGYNFDMFEGQYSEYYFQVYSYKFKKIFILQMLDSNTNIILNNIRINNKGLIYIPQATDCAYNSKKNLRKNEIYFYYLGPLVNIKNNVNQVKSSYLIKKHLAQNPNFIFPIHVLFADKKGNYMIVERDAGGNKFITNKDNFIIMTNFQNSTIEGKSYKAAFLNSGGDRYINAYEYIKDNLNDFNIDKAWETLDRVKQSHTKVSVVILPNENVVYVALYGDFSKVYKISIDNATIETYKGFKDKKVFDISEKRVSSSELLECK